MSMRQNKSPYSGSVFFQIIKLRDYVFYTVLVFIREFQARIDNDDVIVNFNAVQILAAFIQTA